MAAKAPAKTVEQKLADLERRKKKLELSKKIQDLRAEQKKLK